MAPTTTTSLYPLFLALMAALSVSAAPAPALSSSTASPPAKPNATEQFLSEHNMARAAVGVAPLRWSPRLGSEASRLVRHQRDRESCGFADLDDSAYGANQAWARYPAAPAEVVASWVGEGSYYNYSGNSCAAGHECGTYTQVVWRRTAELGCAQASCATAATLTLCFYYPHGNVEGQKPY